MERHRSLRQVYDAIGRDRFSNRSCIQFSSDPAVSREWFGKFTVSEYGGQNSQDICAITYADSSFDWVICNHVLEHIEDDVLALKELLRIARADGIIQVSFPMPHYLSKTNDWGYANPEDHGHYRYYGADVVNRLIEASGAAACLTVVGADSATGAWENAYFLSRSGSAVQELCARVIAKNPAFLVKFR